MEVINTGHKQTLEMLEKVIELKKLERGNHENVTDIDNVIRTIEPAGN